QDALLVLASPTRRSSDLLGGHFEPEEGPGLLRIEFADAEGGAQCGERAGAAGGSAGMADAASVEDHSVREDGEFLLREQGGDVVLGLVRVGLLEPAEASGEAPHVRVD